MLKNKPYLFYSYNNGYSFNLAKVYICNDNNIRGIMGLPRKREEKWLASKSTSMSWFYNYQSDKLFYNNKQIKICVSSTTFVGDFISTYLRESLTNTVEGNHLFCCGHIPICSESWDKLTLAQSLWPVMNMQNEWMCCPHLVVVFMSLALSKLDFGAIIWYFSRPGAFYCPSHNNTVVIRILIRRHSFRSSKLCLMLRFRRRNRAPDLVRRKIWLHHQCNLTKQQSHDSIWCLLVTRMESKGMLCANGLEKKAIYVSWIGC
jgi:hypothetical protein